MTRRLWIGLGFIGAGVIPAIFAVWVFFGDPINQQNFEKIKDGMTEEDVIRILGRAPDDAEVSTDVCFDKYCTKFAPGRSVRRLAWHGFRMDIDLAFHDSGIVHLPFSQVREHDTPLGRFRRWLGLDPPAFLSKSCYQSSDAIVPPD